MGAFHEACDVSRFPLVNLMLGIGAFLAQVGPTGTCKLCPPGPAVYCFSSTRIRPVRGGGRPRSQSVTLADSNLGGGRGGGVILGSGGPDKIITNQIFFGVWGGGPPGCAWQFSSLLNEVVDLQFLQHRPSFSVTPVNALRTDALFLNSPSCISQI